MENFKLKTMALMAMIGTYMGYNYLAKHPEARAMLKNKAKCATKKLYEKLDVMD